MRELGYVEGKNLVIEWRFDDNFEHLSGLAAELVALKPDVTWSDRNKACLALELGHPLGGGN